MKIKPEQLSAHLKTQLLPVYWVQGDEPLLTQEATDAIRHQAIAAGYKREVIYAESQFDGAAFIEASQNLSLFSELKLLEIKLTQAKINEAFNKNLMAYFNQLPSDCVLLISSPRLPSQTQQSAWFRKLDQIGGIIQIWPIDLSHLPSWIQRRAKQKNMNLDFSAAQYLAASFEGNLLALIQTLEKIPLYLPDLKTVITRESIQKLIAADAKFDIFKWTDAYLLSEFARSYQILQQLKAEGTEPVLILWALTKELRLLAKILNKTQQGFSLEQAMNELKVFSSRKVILQKALQRFSLDKIYQTLQQCEQIDLAIKGVEKQSAWELLAHLC